MNIHEYQAKELLRQYGVTVPRGGAAFTADEAEKAAKDLGGPVWVVKSQIHAGGRGAGRFKNDPDGDGGVRVVKSIDDVKSNAASMLGQTLVTKQTGEVGKEVKRVYIEEGADIQRELYLALLVDRATSRVTVMASTEGGVEIEEVAAQTPEKILTATIDPATGIQPHHGRRIGFGLGFDTKQVGEFVKVLGSLYKAFIELDASLLEINPLIVTGDGNILPLDAKMNFDDNALFRQKQVEDMRDLDEEDPAEIEASKYDLNYIKLDGNIGCMVNGAGLAMATMDIIKHFGGEPANFLDVGGGATEERVIAAFKIILSDDNVKGILVNIFGGIVRCDVIADAVVAAAKEVGLDRPLVVRLEGTNVEQGKKTLEQSGLKIIAADDLADGAQKVVNAVQEVA
ncbi:MAG: ADP-forming succinate--CoA ligase subunit beta [Halofilum sp. (in: g-proteobacteria)]